MEVANQFNASSVRAGVLSNPSKWKAQERAIPLGLFYAPTDSLGQVSCCRVVLPASPKERGIEVPTVVMTGGPYAAKGCSGDRHHPAIAFPGHGLVVDPAMRATSRSQVMHRNSLSKPHRG